MRAFLEPLSGLNSFTELEEAMRRRPGVYAAAGVIDSGKSHMVYSFSRTIEDVRLDGVGFTGDLERQNHQRESGCFGEGETEETTQEQNESVSFMTQPTETKSLKDVQNRNTASDNIRLIVTFSEQKARELLESYRFFDANAYYFPAKDILFYQSDVRGTALTRERMLVYRALIEGEMPTVVTTFDALMDRLVRPEVMESFVHTLRPGDTLDLEKMQLHLVGMGYEYAAQVQESGQFCVRGGILDIFPLTEDVPYRIDLWDDEIDSIRSFSPESQRSLENVEMLTIYPASELVLEQEALQAGVDALTADAKRLYDTYRREMKTEEAFRVKQAVEQVREQLLELSEIRQAESYLPYFYRDTVSFLDYISYYVERRTQRQLKPGLQGQNSETQDVIENAQMSGKKIAQAKSQIKTTNKNEKGAPLRNGNIQANDCKETYSVNENGQMPGDKQSQIEKQTTACGSKKRKDLFYIFLDEPARCMEKAEAVEQEFFQSMQQRLEKGYVLSGQADALLSRAETVAALARRPLVLLSSLETRYDDFAPIKSFYFQMKSVNSYNGSFELLLKDLKYYKKEKYRVILLCGSRTRARRLAADLQENGLAAFFTEDGNRVVQAGETMVLYGTQKKGFAYPDVKFVVLTESDIFGAEKKKKRKKKFREGERIASFDELKPGDYVVHENHGLGIFKGIEKIEVNYTLRDYMKIEYDKGGTLYVLATQLDLIQKYAGSDAAKPKLNRLGGQEWTKTRTRVQKAVRLVAKELVQLYAVRQNSEGYQYGPDTIWQREFEELFPFEETDDQLAAIRDVKADMESKKIMDRLICGDVGFGKTEVAIRAAFKVVQENKQVVYLVPTTILAQQHYNNFVQRLKDFPVNVELLCRFRTPAQQRETIARLKNGMADIVIGTHRVLSKDVAFKDLGLLIIDEEQRFGVTHKEKIKQMKKTVDVLTLTATPIPRTLHMSMIGIRDMSVLEEPPEDRMPIQTYIMEYNEEIVREAIEREMARNGQVYFVYNRVNTIAEVAGRIARLVPDAEVAYAHGQMSERELERVMYRFINGEIDVLVSTTIIETGLDIGNVNTMIIHDADNMGLAQLYQLRGRIGRSNRTAYAFLMYRRNKMLREVAEKRLSAIREFTELGSGIRIAMKDLEIRGAGTLLGEQQHGHMEAVGYDLYCKMLNEAVRAAKGEVVEESFETTVDVELDAYIPADYIENEFEKLDIYKRIASVRTEGEREEMLDELIDRFGEPPQAVQNLLLVSQLRQQANALYLTEIKEQPDEIRFTLFERAKLDPTKIPALVGAMQPRLKFVMDKKNPYFVLRRQKSDPSVMELVKKFLGTYGEVCFHSCGGDENKL